MHTPLFNCPSQDVSTIVESGDFSPPVSKPVSRRLDRMTAILEGNQMRVQLGCGDMIGIVFYLSRLVYEYGLSIDDSSLCRLQDENGSMFLVTGSMDRLRKLANRLNREKNLPVEGEVITPYKVFDLLIDVPDRSGLIFDACTIFKNYKVNIKSMTSFLHLGSDDLMWACIKARLEVSREKFQAMSRMRDEIERKFQDAYDTYILGTPAFFSYKGWRVQLDEIKPGKESSTGLGLLGDIDGRLN
jgi:glycine cleavage system regulatory protein